MPDTHLWLSGPTRAALGVAAVYEPAATVDCHRRLRGPYTGTGSVLRTLVPTVHTSHPALAERHAIAILAAAPELSAVIGEAPETLTSMASGRERTRWYSRYRTRRIAHGITDFLRACAATSPLALVFHSVEHADPTDLEFLSIALRRLDPARVRLVICSTGELPSLAAELARYTSHVPTGDPGPAAFGTAVSATTAPGGAESATTAPPTTGPATTRPATTRPATTGPATTGPATTGPATTGAAAEARLAAAFVASDGTSDNPAEREAYERADPEVRARLHDERAAELAVRGEWSLQLGAIPYHLGNGSAAGTAGREACAAALDYCIGMAFYQYAEELAHRLMELTDADAYPLLHYRASAQLGQCLALLDRPAETEPLYYGMLSRTTNPIHHMDIAYTFAMLYTRLYGSEQKNHERALAHVNAALAFASQIQDPADRAFRSVFMNNGKALIAMHLGNLPESLRLVSEGIDRLDRELPPGAHLLHRSVLHHNRAQVLAGLGRPQEALADYAHVVAADPNYPEYRFDRGNLLSKLGRHDEALAEYEAAMRLTPPFPELYFNCGNARAATGDIEGALTDFRYVLDLEPDYVEARVSLASLLLDLGEPESAAREATAGLAASPADPSADEPSAAEPRLHCTLGLALLELGDHPGALRAFDRALELGPGLVEALVNRAVAAYEQGDYDAAIADLTAALDPDHGNPDLLCNRAIAYEAAGRLAEAVADYTLALADERADRADLLYRRGRCYAELGLPGEAAPDFAAHLALGASDHEDDIRKLLESCRAGAA